MVFNINMTGTNSLKYLLFIKSSAWHSFLKRYRIISLLLIRIVNQHSLKAVASMTTLRRLYAYGETL